MEKLNTQETDNENDVLVNEVTIPDLSKPLQKRNTSRWLRKSEILNKEIEVTPNYVGTVESNKYGVRDFLNYTLNDVDYNVNLNKDNVNQLIDILGPDQTKWPTQKVKITGVNSETKIPGVTLVITS